MYQLVRKGNHAVSATVCVRTEEIRLVDQRVIDIRVSGIEHNLELKVDKHSVGGCGGMMRRKKGAVAIRINYKGFRMVFITCHLSGIIPSFIQLWATLEHRTPDLFYHSC
ncbi:hypothetical protein Gorai_012333 [Gossypium raimondii]|uniref:Uncharacterized protein n=1 Tax=Gossypium raimondii TaxID=29730 RepID=A0A7J8Q1P3_GOSRA|nr:hypothetical protein [Gossypium raimondii]